ncbi:MAG: Gll1302 protein [uncultured Sulfurovum sp.]|uniref:Gll1302 protein n=1 Tax=uncultured Sulfurovum sp. TaxID=269237 RepID=A0A6S6TAG4_9BACT|nr:MAG: Gll1302 protein [uncultured Sulfurovum sp.]
MNNINALIREVKFTARDLTVWFWLLVVLSLSTLSLWSGLTEVERQNASIQSLLAENKEERLSEQKKYDHWGYLAYYSFHLTYDAPSGFAFAAMGLRDSQAWKHRVRMLALEGQIYERDVGNPSIALIGRFDFAFFTAFIIPIILIMLLFDLRSSEKAAGRYALLEVTAGNRFSLWGLRALVRSGGVFLALILPLVVVGIIAGIHMGTLFLAILAVLAYMIFWTLLSVYVSAWRKSGSVILMSLLAIWMLTAVILPAGLRIAIDKTVHVPSGTDIVMLQREVVNDAWDIPREETMNDFFAEHPEWKDYEPIEDSFEWQWYYAFQQIGDERTKELSTLYRDGRLERDKIASWFSLLALPSLLERYLQSLAKTDLKSTIEYEERVRKYHASLRAFYYPKFFNNEPFERAELKKLPMYLSH